MPLDLGDALSRARGAEPGSLTGVSQVAAEGLGATDVVVYLVDYAQSVLQAVPAAGGSTAPLSEEVATTMAGRAFTDRRAVLAARPEGVRIWVPIMEGSDRSGVLAVTVPDAGEAVVRACEELGMFVGYLVAVQSRVTDFYHRQRRRRSLSQAASMQWDLLPPLVVKTQRFTVAGILEPAYEVAGDCFDYAINGVELDVGVFDPLGHTVGSALLAAMCVGTYRHGRRDRLALDRVHGDLDAAVAREFPQAFATGQLARIDGETGAMEWTNAGHPLPLLIRNGKVIGELPCPATLPWGLGALDGVQVQVPLASEPLEPGDGVLFYTDGVVEAHLPGGEQFGIERLVDLLGQHLSAGLDPEETVRRLVRSVLDHQGDDLRDDATLVMCTWHGPPR
ncbi:MAG: PP2C family protein-serine/threonine phosphatase [Acidimicrobiales bacterium]